MIIVFGSVNVDMVVPVDRFPEAGETIIGESYIKHTGGKGANFAVAAARCEVKVGIVGRVGHDGFGRLAQNNLKQHSIRAAGVGIVEDKPTGTTIIMVTPDGESRVVITGGANLESTADQLPNEAMGTGNIIIADLGMPHKAVWDVIKRAKECGNTTMLCASPTRKIPDDVLHATDYLFYNEKEANELGEIYGLPRTDPKMVAVFFANKYQLTNIVTMGRNGAIAIAPDEAWHVDAMEVINMVDKTGAGDTFCGVMAAYMERGLPMEEVLQRAAIAGSMSCKGLGSQGGMPWYDDIEENLNKVDVANPLT